MAKFAVLHLEKGAGNDAPISSHIERTVNPSNADKECTHLNRELIQFPDGVRNRTEAIQYRIEHADIIRKISHNQVRAIRVIMTGSPEQMQRIQNESKLNEWCRESLDWLRKEVGSENIVSAVLHMDEQTPHIHATVVPIVIGERRKAKQEQQKAGKKYKKKNINTPRLCADDIMSKERFKQMQDTYARAMGKFGLVRGKEGSEARHISTQQYYRELVGRNEDLKEIIQEQEYERQEVYDKTRDLYDRKDEARDKFLNMHEYNKQKEREISETESRLEKLKQEYEPYRAQEELNLIHNLFPMMREQLRIADLCMKIGLAVNSIKALLEGRNLTAKTFSFFSPEHKHKFTAEDVKLKMEKEPDNPDKLRLNLNGVNILDWFREQYQRVKQTTNHYTRPNIKPEIGKNKGIKM